MTNFAPALDAALKVAALDGGSYQLGEHIFWSTLEQSSDIDSGSEKAIINALLHVVPDSSDFDRWWKAYETFWNMLAESAQTNDTGKNRQSLSDKLMGFKSRLGSKGARKFH